MPIQTQKVPYVEHLELSVNIVAPFVSAYFLFLLRRPVFHLNLRILLANFTIGLTGITISRCVILIYIYVTNLMKPKFWMQVIHDTFVHGLLSASVLMAGERVIATLYVDIYENVKGWWIAILSCLGMQTIDFTVAYLAAVWRDNVTLLENGSFQFNNPSHRYYLCASTTIMFMANLSGFVMFFFIHRYNRKRWSIDLSKKLSHRYQISENIRTSKQLFILLIGDVVISTYLCMVILYIFYFQRRDFIADAIAQLLDLSMAIATVIMPMLFIFANPKLRQHVLRHFRIRERNLAWTHRSVSNRPLVFAIATEGNVYFKELEKSWTDPSFKCANVRRSNK